MRQSQITVGGVAAVPILGSSADGVTAILRAEPTNSATLFLGARNVIAAGIGLIPGQAQAVYLEPGEDLWGISTLPGQLVSVLSAPGGSHFAPMNRQLVQLVDSAGSAGAGPFLNSSFDAIGVGAYLGVITQPLAYNGASFDKIRIPAIFKPLNAVASGVEVTIWTPPAGKKFRLMRHQLVTSVAGNIILRDNTAGVIIDIVPSAAGGSGIWVDLGNGILSAAANNLLTATGPAASTLSGRVIGTEE